MYINKTDQTFVRDFVVKLRPYLSKGYDEPEIINVKEDESEK